MAEMAAELQDYEQQFLAILNNRQKYATTGDSKDPGPPRDRGFIVVVPEAVSLRPLQDLCHGPAQTYNKCITLRFRLDGPSTFGTLIWAIRSSILRFGDEPVDLPSDYRSAEGVSEALIPALRDQSRSELEAAVGPVTVPAFLLLLQVDALSGEASKGMRLVFFCERTEPASDADEWISALNQLLPDLPERVGLVLSGAPDLSAVMRTKSLISDATNFLQLDVPNTDDTGEIRYRSAGLSSDQTAQRDLLNVGRYALGLAEFVLHPDTQPLTIGIHGKWGAGKSSFMKFVERHLVENAPANRGPQHDLWAASERQAGGLRAELDDAELKLRTVLAAEREPLERRVGQLHDQIRDVDGQRARRWAKMERKAPADVVTVWFNAWQFQDAKQIWAGLASEIIGRLESTMSPLGRLRLRLAYVWKAFRGQLVASGLVALAAVAASVVLMVFQGVDNPIVAALLSGAKKTPAWTALAGTVVAVPVLSLVFLVWRIYKLALPVSTRVLQYAQLPSYRDQMGFQHKVLADVRFVSSRLGRDGKTPKVVIFIDDLDRCSEDKILEVLQAVNLILGASNFFVFLGVDTEMIHAAIESHYDRQKLLRDRRRNLARLYLRKIIQLSFHIPATGKDAHEALISEFFTPAVRAHVNGGSRTNGSIGTVQPSVRTPFEQGGDGVLEVVPGAVIAPDSRKFEEVVDTPEELQTFFDYRSFIDTNARETKRLLNVHRLVKILLQPTQGWPPDQQRKLVKWLIFCTRWPHLIDDVFDVIRDHGPSENAILSMVRARNLAEFDSGDLAKFAATKTDVLSSDAISEEDSPLRMAAFIAETIRDDPEPDMTEDRAPESPARRSLAQRRRRLIRRSRAGGG